MIENEPLEHQLSRLEQRIAALLERERLFREDHSQHLMAEMRAYIDERLRHWTATRASVALPPGAPVFTHTVDGHRIMLDPNEPFITLHVIEHGSWELPLRRALACLLSAGDHYIDVGANIGLHALYASTLVGETGRVLTLEPHPDTASLLRRNLEINGLLERVTILQCAASMTDREARLFEYFPEHSAMSGFGLVPERLERFSGTRETISVECVRLDRVIRQLGYVEPVVKIDVEGWEPDVVDGLGELIDDPGVVLLMEFDPSAMDAVIGKGAADRLYTRVTEKGRLAFAVAEAGLESVTCWTDPVLANDVLFIHPSSRRYAAIAEQIVSR